MEKKTDKKKAPKKKAELVATVRSDERKVIGANIFLGQSSDGKKSHYFSLSRAWKSAGERWNYSDRMYADHSEALVEVIKKAAVKCEELDATITEEATPFDDDNIPFPDMAKEAA